MLLNPIGEDRILAFNQIDSQYESTVHLYNLGQGREIAIVRGAQTLLCQINMNAQIEFLFLADPIVNAVIKQQENELEQKFEELEKKLKGDYPQVCSCQINLLGKAEDQQFDLRLDLNSQLVTGFAKAKNSKWQTLKELDADELLQSDCQGSVDILQKDEQRAIVISTKESARVYSLSQNG